MNDPRTRSRGSSGARVTGALLALLILSVLGSTLTGDETAIPIDGSADTIAARVEDAAITATVRTALLRNRDMEGTSIDVVTNERRVTLAGEVPSAAASALAAQIASNANGVISVVNRLEVTAPGN